MSTPDVTDLRVLFVGTDSTPVESALDSNRETSAAIRAVSTGEELTEALDDGFDVLVCRFDAATGFHLDCLDRVRTVAPSTPVLALVDGEAQAGRALSAGATDYLDQAVASDNEALLADRIESITVDSGTAGASARSWYESLVEHSTDLLTVLDSDGSIVYQSPSVEQLLGYEQDELVGTDVFELLHPDDLDRVEEAFESLLSGREGVTGDVQHRVADADGSWVWFESVGATRTDASLDGYVINGRAIAERKAHEHEREQYETLLGLIPDTVVVTDDDGIMVDIYGFEGWSGYDPDDLLGESVRKISPDADAERGKAVFEELVRDDDREKATFETSVVTENGESIPFENHVTLLPADEDGETPGSMSVLRNVSDRKERQRRLEEAETVFENVQDGVFLVDVTDDGRYVYQRANEPYEAIMDCTEEAIRGESPRDVVPDPDIAAEIESAMTAVVDSKSVRHEEREIDVRGAATYWETWIAPVVVDGEVTNLVGVVRDVTERKRREQELELKNRAMDEAPIGITIAEAHAEKRSIVYANDGFEELTGYDEADVLGEDWSVLRGEETDGDAAATLERGIEDAEPASAELVIYRQDGAPRWCRASVAPVRNDDGDVTHFVGFQQDVTDRKEYETEIERRFDEFSDVFAAEIRGPLHEAMAALDAVSEDGGGDELDAVDEWLQRTDELVEDLATVHSFSVPSREHSESALRASPPDE